MSNNVGVFIESVCSHIRYRKIHKEIAQELMDHIEDLRQNLMDDGMGEEEATDRAVKLMGNPDDIGVELNKTHRPKVEWSIVLIVGALLIISNLLIFYVASLGDSRFATSLMNNIMYSVMGLIVFTGCYFYDYRRLEKYSMAIFLITNGMLFWMPLLRNRFDMVYLYNGLIHLKAGFISIQPFSLAMPLLLVSFAGIVNKGESSDMRTLIKISVCVLITIASVIVSSLIRDVILILCGYVAIVTVAVVNDKFKISKKKLLLSIYGGGSVFCFLGLYLLILSRPYMIMRLKHMLMPYLDPKGMGYQSSIVINAVQNAKLIGGAVGSEITDTSIVNILPDADSYYILTFVLATFGWLAFIGIVGLLTVILSRMYFAVTKIKCDYGKLVSFAITIVFCVQIVSAVFASMGFFLALGGCIPLIGYEGALKIVNIGLLGLFLGIYRRKDLIITVA